MIDANKYPKRALVVVFGTTPAVVTETIFGLAQRTPQFIPTEIHIITTLHGERIARQRLFEPETGSYWRLSGEYRLHLPKEVYIHVAGAEEPGCAIEDLRTSQQNQLSANTIGRVIETLAADPDCAMHVSLAGGRKTMSYYAGYALSIYGRVQDSLSHVLVNDPFEDVPEFEYPPFEPRMMMQRNGTQILSSNAHVDLPEVPFVRIGAALDRKLIPRGLDFSKVIERIDALLPILTGHAPIILDVKERSLRAGTIQIRLDNQTTGFYWAVGATGDVEELRISLIGLKHRARANGACHRANGKNEAQSDSVWKPAGESPPTDSLHQGHEAAQRTAVLRVRQQTGASRRNAVLPTLSPKRDQLSARCAGQDQAPWTVFGHTANGGSGLD